MLPLAYQVETIRLGEKTVEIPKKIQVTSMMRWGTTLGNFIRFVFKTFLGFFAKEKYHNR